MTNLDDIIDGNGLVISGRTEPLVFADYDEMIKWLKQEAHQWDLLYEKAQRFSLRETAFDNIFDNIFNVQKMTSCQRLNRQGQRLSWNRTPIPHQVN